MEHGSHSAPRCSNSTTRRARLPARPETPAARRRARAPAPPAGRPTASAAAGRPARPGGQKRDSSGGFALEGHFGDRAFPFALHWAHAPGVALAGLNLQARRPLGLLPTGGYGGARFLRTARVFDLEDITGVAVIGAGDIL